MVFATTGKKYVLCNGFGPCVDPSFVVQCRISNGQLHRYAAFCNGYMRRVETEFPPDQTPSDLPPDEDEILDEDEEDAFRLEDVSSDVEVPADV